jgi:hypothetical protein
VREWHGKDFVKVHAVYKNKKQADKYMHEFNGIESLTTGTLGYSVPPERCRSGDVVTALVGPETIALGFVFNGFGYFKGKKAVVKVPLENCRMGWRL